MAAILKFKMAATRGRFRGGYYSKNDPTGVHYLCAKFHAFFTKCTMCCLSRWTKYKMGVDVSWQYGTYLNTGFWGCGDVGQIKHRCCSKFYTGK